MKDIYDLLKELKDRGGKIYKLDGKLKLEIKAEKLTDEIKEKIKFFKEDILELIGETNRFEFSQIEKAPLQASYPLSDAQKRLWLIDQLEAGSVAYNLPGNLYLDSNVEIESVKKAIIAVVDRHEILRTVFREDQSGEIKQWVLTREELGFEIEYIDYRQEENKQELIENHLNKDANKNFDLENGPLFTVGLLHIEDSDYVYYYNMHHIVSDGWSLNVYFSDLRTYYDAYVKDLEPELADLRIQYKDYSVWQLAQLEEETFKFAENYWLTKLSGQLPVLDLPTTKQRPKVKTNNGQNIDDSVISPAIVRKLREFSEANGASDFMTLFAAWNVLLYRYTGQSDMIVGTPVSGREHVDMKEQIGFYVNTVPMRSTVDPNESFNDFASKNKKNMMESFASQAYPFNRLVEELDLVRDPSRNPIFEVMLVYGNEKMTTPESSAETGQFKLSGFTNLKFDTSQFDLEVGFKNSGDDVLSIWAVFNPDVYEEAMIKTLLRHYKQLLRRLLETPERKIGEVDFLSEIDKEELLVDFNSSGKIEVETEGEYKQDEETILALFDKQVKNNPYNTAIVWENKNLTYKELDEQSNQLAHYLINNFNVQRNDLIGIKQERSDRMIVSMLAILKTSGAYVPIDVTYPKDRIDYIEKDAGCKIVLDGEQLNYFIERQEDYSTKALNLIRYKDDYAYIIYTSGSTGNPKGVVISMDAMSDYVKTFQNQFQLNSLDTVVQQASISFDIAVEEIFPTICSGAKLIIASEGARDVDLLIDLIEEQKVTLLSTVPLVINELNQQFKRLSSLRILISGGDELKGAYISNLLNTTTIYNTYGPTESTVCATYHKVKSIDDAKLIGRPILNRKIYILDQNDQLAVKGLAGEICIAGKGLAIGYHNQPDLTKEKFIDNPFEPGQRMYRSGDLGKWTNEGEIEFLGRKDDQVKIRGYRIELGEIEHAMLSNLSIESVTVVASENDSNGKYLIGYFKAEQTLMLSDVRIALKEVLPEYMIPSFFIQMDKLPLMPNGKIDKNALPNPDESEFSTGIEYVGPRNEIEAKLVKIWQEVLQRENIGIKDDFFALGGNSLKGIKVVSQINKVFDASVKIGNIFTASTVEEIGYNIEFALNQKNFKNKTKTLKEIEL